MEFTSFEKEGFEQVRLLDPYKKIYMVYLSPKEEGEEIKSFPFRVEHEPRNYELRMQLLRLQKEYDTSKYVNTFVVGEREAWLDKATRVGLMNSLGIQQAAGLTNTTLWINGKDYTMPIPDAISFLSDLELYAVACNGVTQRHLAEIRALETIEDILAFDITEGYPPKIVFPT